MLQGEALEAKASDFTSRPILEEKLGSASERLLEVLQLIAQMRAVMALVSSIDHGLVELVSQHGHMTVLQTFALSSKLASLAGVT